jgi:hypothetical protein
LSSLPSLACDEIVNSRNYLGYELMIWNLWGTWHHYQPSLLSLSICSLFLWCLYAPSSWSNDDWHDLRPTVFIDMLTVFIDTHCVYIWPLFLYMLTIFTYTHCLNICSLPLHMLTVFTYAHCFDICLLFLYMLTEFMYAHWVYICSLFLHMLTMFICGHYFYICSLFLHMLTVFIYAHWVYICSLFAWMLLHLKTVPGCTLLSS